MHQRLQRRMARSAAVLARLPRTRTSLRPTQRPQGPPIGGCTRPTRLPRLHGRLRLPSLLGPRRDHARMAAGAWQARVAPTAGRQGDQGRVPPGGGSLQGRLRRGSTKCAGLPQGCKHMPGSLSSSACTRTRASTSARRSLGRPCPCPWTGGGGGCGCGCGYRLGPGRASSCRCCCSLSSGPMGTGRTSTTCCPSA
jgi:hypothetical protein